MNLKPVLKFKSLAGKKALVRVDFNLPLEKNRVRNDFRVKKTLPLIRALQKKKAKVILISHLENNGKIISLRPLARYLRKNYLKNLKFVPDLFGRQAKKAISEMKNGDSIILENLRMKAGEKNNDKKFSRQLASLADIYINEAFSVSHRKHASIVGLPEFLPSFAGPLFLSEISNLKKVFNPTRPFLLILGGKKISTKFGLLKNFINKADKIVVAGAIANFYLKEKGYEIGKSYREKPPAADFSKIKKAKNIIFPEDAVVFRNQKRKTVQIKEVRKQDVIYDVGPRTISKIKKEISRAKFILWNGPLGYVEGGYGKGTKETVQALILSKAKIVAGGGDTVAFLEKHKSAGKRFFISTAGGALLAFLSRGVLPGIEALEK
ncbi:MAG: phosphoglycerate kinase [Patescibacteria group bacterium]